MLPGFERYRAYRKPADSRTADIEAEIYGDWPKNRDFEKQTRDLLARGGAWPKTQCRRGIQFEKWKLLGKGTYGRVYETTGEQASAWLADYQDAGKGHFFVLREKLHPLPPGKHAVAVKVIAPDLNDPKAVADFRAGRQRTLHLALREAYVHGSLPLSQYWPVLYEYSVDHRGYVYQVMALAGGTSLLNWLADNKDPEKRQKVLRRVRQAVEALWTEGFAHNDLHLDNVLVNDRTLQVHIIDFGFAKPLRRPRPRDERWRDAFLAAADSRARAQGFGFHSPNVHVLRTLESPDGLEWVDKHVERRRAAKK